MTKKGSGKTIPKIKVEVDPSPEQREELLATLQDRFEQNMERHQGVEWSKVQARLEAQPEKLSALFAMESSGGEPDVVAYDEETDEYVFFDCCVQSPEGRRKICYDGEAQKEREKKGVSPAGNAVDLAPPWASSCWTKTSTCSSSNWENSIPGPRAGCGRLPVCASWAAPVLAIAATIVCSCFTTVRRPFIPPGASAARSGSNSSSMRGVWAINI